MEFPFWLLLALTNQSLSNCEHLKTLDLESNELQELVTGVFRHCESLQILQLAKNKIFNIEVNAFEGLTKLYYLDIQGNSLTMIPPTTLQSLPAVLIFSLVVQTSLKSIPTHSVTAKNFQLFTFTTQCCRHITLPPSENKKSCNA